MFPIGPPGQGKPGKVRRYPYLIVPIEPPKDGIPDGAIFMETLVFSLSPYPAEKVLADYCGTKGLDSSKFRCHPVVFAKDMRQQGTGTISIHRNGDRFRMGVNWRR